MTGIGKHMTQGIRTFSLPRPFCYGGVAYTLGALVDTLAPGVYRNFFSTRLGFLRHNLSPYDREMVLVLLVQTVLSPLGSHLIAERRLGKDQLSTRIRYLAQPFVNYLFVVALNRTLFKTWFSPVGLFRMQMGVLFIQTLIGIASFCENYFNSPESGGEETSQA